MTRSQQHMDILSRLVFSGLSENFEEVTSNLETIYPDVQHIAALSEKEWEEFLFLANENHVEVRALSVLQKAAEAQGAAVVAERCKIAISEENARIRGAVTALKGICEVMEANGCPVVVIKSLDHWPDLGSDLDLYTSATPDQVLGVMQRELKAELHPRSWGDRLANKWNFKIPDLPELIEIHVQYLGQTGEHKALARRALTRRLPRNLDGMVFEATSPEERIIISTLQRMYRHFYFRLCDMLDVATLLKKQTLDFVELQRASEKAGIWPGVATFLLIVSRYAESYGRKVELPQAVISAATVTDVWFAKNFLRVSKVSAAGLFGNQLLKAGLHGDLRAMFRLPLLPPLAVSALVAYRVTGSDKGVW